MMLFKSFCKLSPLSIALFACLGCAAQGAGETFSNEFDCDEPSVEDLGSSRYRVDGCGRSVIYTCVTRNDGNICVTDSTPEPSGLAALEQTPKETKGARAKRETKDGQALLKLDVVLDERSVLRMRANPKKDGDTVQVSVVHRGELPDCTLSWLVDGTVQDVLAAKFDSGETSKAKLTLNRSGLADLSQAKRVALKACDERWSLRESQIEELESFLSMYEEELAWGGGSASAAEE